MKIKLLVFALLFSVIGWGQTTLAAWTFPTTTGNAPNTLVAECGIFSATSNFYADGTNGSSNWSVVATRQYFGGVAPASALCGVTTATGSYTLVAPATPFNNGFSVVYRLPTTGYQDLILNYSTRGTAAGYTTHDWSYSTDGVTFTPHATIGGRNATAFSNQTVDFSAIGALDNLANVYIKLTVTGATALSGNNRFDNVNFTGVILGGTPTITVLPTTLTGFNYVVGNGPSANQTFVASGVNLTGNLVLTAPTNYEIATVAAGPFSGSISLTPTTGTVAATTIYVRLKAGLGLGNYNLENIAATSAGATTQNVTCSGSVTGSNNSDVIAVAGSESATVSSIINNNAPLTSATGVQVWQFRVRDGGATLSDADTLPTILTAFTLAQAGGNQVGTWSDAINTIELFDGATRIAAATVTGTQIQFTGLNISVADNTEITLSLRMSLKCPLGADAFDGEDFMFSLSNANVTFSPTGSGKAAFGAQTSANGQNVIQIIATRLSFTSQPVTTGVNSTMGNVVVAATDSCGNIDPDFTGTITLTSTGTMTGAPLNGTAVAGVATYVGIIHTVIGSGYTMNASSVGLTGATSSLFDILNVTTLVRGDLAILAVNTNLASNPGNDQIAFVCFQDILPGTKIYLTDNGYERQFANEWGGTEGVISITRTGSTLTKGTIIVIEGNVASGNIDAATEFDVYTCGAVDTNWTKTAISGGSIGGFNLNSNDDVWIMQGGTWTNSITHHSTYDGNVLYGWTESGWDAAPGGASQSTQWSTIFPTLECYNTVAPVGGGKVKFNDPVNPDFSTITNGKLDWIALINNFANWDTYTNDALYNAGGYDYKGNASCPQMTIANVGYVNGKWTGRVDTNWFNCGNWDTLVVPDATVDVQVGDNTFNNQAIVDATAPQSDYYGDIAQARNLTITGEKVEVTTALTNILEVHGNLLIDAPAGALDMNAGGATDGHLQLYGNWTNNMGSAAFDEGNGTVTFTGTTPQIINNVTPEGTETFHHLILNNNFDTSVSNDIIATGDLTVNATKTLTVSPNDYAQVTNAVLNSGTVTVENNGSLVQINDGAINTGTITARRSASQRLHDYVYWSAPVSGFNLNYFTTTGGTSFIYQWNPIAVNPNGGEGNWGLAAGAMTPGRGYIVRGNNAYNNTAPTTWTANFSGPANNGIIPVTVFRGNDYTGAGTQGLPRTAQDDNWNLIGNPYPSAIDVLSTGGFLDANPALEGFIKIWTHGTLPSSTIDPFYQNFVLNYYGSDYITLNRTGLISGPGDYKVGAGQGFFVLMDTGAAGSATVNFNNSMRNRTFVNNQFYRTADSNPNSDGNSSENWDIKNSRSRIWLDLISSTNVSNRTLVGYVLGATNDKDRMYDATTTTKASQHFYSVINNDLVNIQGRALPFKTDDFVPMGIKVPTDGNYKIAIATVDGVFADKKQKIYLEDKELGILHDLTNAPYDFATSKGIFNDRFVIRYKDKKATEENNEIKSNDIMISSSDNQIQIMSDAIKVTNYEIYNVLGQSIAMKNDVNTNKVIETSIQKNNQALLIKIQLENGQTVVKKIIF